MVTGLIEQAEKGGLVTQIKIDANLTAAIDKSVKEAPMRRLPRDYFYVTELVNPAQSYWSRVHPVSPSLDIKKKLAHGSKVHYISQYWFSKLPGFRFSEASLVGDYVDIERVSGKVDYFVNNSIIELKTKSEGVDSVDKVINEYPHDLEQLLIYESIYTERENTHYLVFTKEADSFKDRKIYAYKVKVNNEQVIRDFLIRRRDMLDEALRVRNTTDLPQCRYFSGECQYKEAGVCNCKNLEKESAGIFERSVEVSFDEDLSARIKSENDSASMDSYSADLDYLWNVILPMKYYHKIYSFSEDEELEFVETSPEKQAARAMVENATYHSGITVKGDLLNELKEKDVINVGKHRKFLCAAIPSVSSGMIPIPYIIKISYTDKEIFSDDWFPSIYSAEAVLKAVNSGSRCSAVIVHYPNLDNKTVVYVICADTGKVKHAVESIKEEVKKAYRAGKPDNLPLCPDYMRTKCEYSSCYCVVGRK